MDCLLSYSEPNKLLTDIIKSNVILQFIRAIPEFEWAWQGFTPIYIQFWVSVLWIPSNDDRRRRRAQHRQHVIHKTSTNMQTSFVRTTNEWRPRSHIHDIMHYGKKAYPNDDLQFSVRPAAIYKAAIKNAGKSLGVAVVRLCKHANMQIIYKTVFLNVCALCKWTSQHTNIQYIQHNWRTRRQPAYIHTHACTCVA